MATVPLGDTPDVPDRPTSVVPAVDKAEEAVVNEGNKQTAVEEPAWERRDKIAFAALVVAIAVMFSAVTTTILNYSNRPQLPKLEYSFYTGNATVPGDIVLVCNIKNTGNVAAKDVYVVCNVLALMSRVECI